jgi:hypothetical protein
VGIKTDDFVWEDALEEIRRFENVSVDMTFKSCSHFLSVSSYIYGEAPLGQSIP